MSNYAHKASSIGFPTGTGRLSGIYDTLEALETSGKHAF